jgi:hypothetical protein
VRRHPASARDSNRRPERRHWRAHPSPAASHSRPRPPLLTLCSIIKHLTRAHPNSRRDSVFQFSSLVTHNQFSPSASVAPYVCVLVVSFCLCSSIELPLEPASTIASIQSSICYTRLAVSSAYRLVSTAIRGPANDITLLDETAAARPLQVLVRRLQFCALCLGHSHTATLPFGFRTNKRPLVLCHHKTSQDRSILALAPPPGLNIYPLVKRSLSQGLFTRYNLISIAILA